MSRFRHHLRSTGLASALAGVFTFAILSGEPAAAWPLDDSDDSRIGRLEYMRRIESGQLQGTKQPPGALLPTSAVRLRMLEHAAYEAGTPDTGLSAALRGLLGARAADYSVALLDLSNPERPYYAEHRAEKRYNPGSVGKLLVANALLQAVADVYPDDLAARWQFLRDTRIEADGVIVTDSHTVRRWDSEQETLIRRPLEIGDPGTLFEFLDWMVSPSSNAAASVLIRQTMLLNEFGRDYPLSPTAAETFFETTAARELTTLLARTLQKPVTRNGFELENLRQGSLFTRSGKALVSGTSSRASARELLRFLLRIEQGRVIDSFSSAIIKKLMYVTERRIRYARAPALRDAAVYFKSGSLYKCAEEVGFKCRKYRGNVLNLMHSAAIVESHDEQSQLHYIIVLMSNVLRQNSASDHQEIAAAVHGLLKARNPANAAIAVETLPPAVE
jgi:hypothetical protein